MEPRQTEDEQKAIALVSYCETFRIKSSEATLALWLEALERFPASAVRRAVARISTSSELRIQAGASVLAPLLREIRDEVVWNPQTETSPGTRMIEDPAGKPCTWAEFKERRGGRLPWAMSRSEQHSGEAQA